MHSRGTHTRQPRERSVETTNDLRRFVSFDSSVNLVERPIRCLDWLLAAVLGALIELIRLFLNGRKGPVGQQLIL